MSHPDFQHDIESEYPEDEMVQGNEPAYLPSKGLAEALVRVHDEMPTIKFDMVNPHFQSKFASLQNELKTVRPILAKHGITLHWKAGSTKSELEVACILMHRNGECLSSGFVTVAVPDNPQKLKSATPICAGLPWSRSLASRAMMTTTATLPPKEPRTRLRRGPTW